ncbi:unnamed protein product [Orchesella dallaii]|uniref:Odorant receptor n=1 Tax=Orchesella dallaii TaxID=48710 RepID=A0ABP1RZR1_9HEXA
MRGHMLRWDSEKKRLTADTSKKSLNTVQFYRHLRICYATGMILQVILTNYNQSGGSLMSKTEIAFYLTAVIANDFHLNECFKKASDIVLYVNGLIIFSEKYNQNKKWKSHSLLEKLDIGVAYSMYVTAATFAFNFVVLQHWNEPCKSFFLGYQLLDECGIFKIIENVDTHVKYNITLGIKLSFLMFNYLVFNVGVQLAAFVIGGLQSLCTITLCGHIATFKNIWIEGEIPRLDASLIHREIQVMATIFNKIQQGSLMTVAIVQPVILLALCSFTLLKTPWNGDTVGVLAQFSLIVFDTALVVMVTLGGMAKVHNASKEAIDAMKQNVNCMANSSNNFVTMKGFKWQRKFVESCSPIKVKFGTDNFVEDDTPLNCISQAFDLTVQLLLLGV